MKDIGPQWPDTSGNSVCPKPFSTKCISLYNNMDNSINLDTPICNPKHSSAPRSYDHKWKTSEELSTYLQSMKYCNHEAIMT